MHVDPTLFVRELLRKYGITEALRKNITEFAINAPLAYWVEDFEGWHQVSNPILTLSNLRGLVTVIADFNKKIIDENAPIASVILPEGERCQIVLPPACENGTISITIRKPSSSRFTLRDYADSGRFTPLITNMHDDIHDWESHLLKLMQAGNFIEFFELAVKHRLNIVTVGGTGSGKTTFSKTLIDLDPSDRRIFTAEDAHELTTPNHPNAVHLFFSPTISAKTILANCMRMKPDHIFITELRGDEAWDYLMALKSGHSGSVTSIHANDCRGALYKIGSYIKQSDVGQSLDFNYIMREVMTTIDIVVFFEDTYIKEIYYDPSNKLKLLRGTL